MLRLLYALPLIVILTGIAALAMLVPALHALGAGDYPTMRAFAFAAGLLGILTTLAGIAGAGAQVRRQARSHLITLLATYIGLPVLLALPLYEAVGDTSFVNAYFEMVSALTTTGATVFSDPGRLADSVHLWRALVGWLGGFFAWVTAIAIMAPLNLGGFEVLSTAPVGRGVAGAAQIARVADASERLARYAARLLPIYAGLTGILWIALLVLGDSAFVALCHAMSTMATSGISPVGGLTGSNAGFLGEGVLFLFLVFALSRQTFTSDSRAESARALVRDPEFAIGLAIVIGVPTLLFLRHFVGAIEQADAQDLAGAAQSFWGGLFMVMSFLTTAGFESQSWDEARAWSGLNSPGLLLLGLSIFGGGVATTAGGVKLLRVYALFRHGQRELDKLVLPHSVGGAGQQARHMRRQGAYVAWVFFMLFAMSIALVMAALTAWHIDFQSVTILAIAALSNTGPLALVAGETPIDYAALADGAKLVLGAAMVLGRLEMLVIVALLNPDFWRG